MSDGIRTLMDAYAVVRPSFFALLPVLLVVLFGVIALVADLFEHGSTRGPAEGEEGISITAPYLSMIGVALGLGAVVWHALVYARVAGSYFNGMLIIDTFGLFVAGVVLAATLLTLLITVGYCRRHNMNLAEYYHLILMAAAGMVLMAQSGHLVMVFVALELLSVSVYVLTGFRRNALRSVEGALKYFVLGAFSTGFFLYGMALVYGATGSMHIATVGHVVANGGGGTMVLAGLGLLVVGFSFKVALVPFHMWSPDVYEGAPSPITGFMATGVKAAAFAAFARVLLTAFGPLVAVWVPLLWVLAVLTMFLGNLAAIQQDDIKRMLAYSSIAHAGYLAVALVAASPAGQTALAYYLAAYTLMTLGAFGVVSVFGARGEDANSISRDYAGLAYRNPLLAAAMAVFLFSLTGIPPTAGFVGKFAILLAAVESGHVLLALLLVVASLVAAYYYLRVVVVMYMGDAGEASARVRVGAMTTFALVVAVVGILSLGLFPAHWIDLAGGGMPLP